MTHDPLTPGNGPADPSPEGAVSPTGHPARRVGRRGFVTGAVFAGSVATAAVVGRATGDDGRSPDDAVPTSALVLAGGGIDPSGTEDSTSAIQRLLDGAPEGAWLWLPEGVYLVDGVVLRAGQMLSGPSARHYLGRATTGARLRAGSAGLTNPVLTVGEFGRVADVSVEGRGRSGPAIRPGGLGVSLQRVSMTDGSVGYDAAYVSGNVLTECLVHENDVGIKDLVDSMVALCTINANGSDGVSLGPGANDNVFVGNKVEWNDGCGINALQAVHNVVVGGILDRNGRAGVRVVECGHSSVTGLVLRRNGRLSEGTPEDDCHVYQQDCTAFLVTGVVTNDGADDDDGGYRSPSVAIREDGGTDIGYTGNDLTGHTSDVAIARGSASTRGSSSANLGVAGVQRLSGAQIQVSSDEFPVDPGSSGAATVVLGALEPNTLGVTYRVRLVTRDGGSGVRSVAEGVLVVSRDDGPATVTLGTVVDLVGAAFGGTAALLQVSAASSSDGSTVDIAVRNGGSATVRVGVQVS